MSTLFLSMLLLLNTNTTFNEPSDSLQQRDYNYYMQKSKNQRTGATVLMLTGVVIGSVTLLLAAVAALGEGLTAIVTLGTAEPQHRSYTIPALLSLAAIGGGILLFSAASRSKKTAKGLSLGVGIGSSPLLQQQSVKNSTYPSLSLKIGL